MILGCKLRATWFIIIRLLSIPAAFVRLTGSPVLFLILSLRNAISDLSVLHVCFKPVRFEHEGVRTVLCIQGISVIQQKHPKRNSHWLFNEETGFLTFAFSVGLHNMFFPPQEMITILVMEDTANEI